MGIAATGKTAEWTVIIIGRLADGKLVEDLVEYDRLGLYRQLGVIPLDGWRIAARVPPRFC